MGSLYIEAQSCVPVLLENLRGMSCSGTCWPLACAWFQCRYGLPWWLRWESVHLQCGKPGFNPWVRKISWRRKWQSTPVLLPGKSHGQKSLVGYSPWGGKESDTTERLHSLSFSGSREEEEQASRNLTGFSLWITTSPRDLSPDFCL